MIERTWWIHELHLNVRAHHVQLAYMYICVAVMLSCVALSFILIRRFIPTWRFMALGLLLVMWLASAPSRAVDMLKHTVHGYVDVCYHCTRCPTQSTINLDTTWINCESNVVSLQCKFNLHLTRTHCFTKSRPAWNIAILEALIGARISVPAKFCIGTTASN